MSEQSPHIHPLGSLEYPAKAYELCRKYVSAIVRRRGYSVDLDKVAGDVYEAWLVWDRKQEARIPSKRQGFGLSRRCVFELGRHVRGKADDGGWNARRNAMDWAVFGDLENKANLADRDRVYRMAKLDFEQLETLAHEWVHGLYIPPALRRTSPVNVDQRRALLAAYYDTGSMRQAGEACGVTYQRASFLISSFEDHLCSGMGSKTDIDRTRGFKTLGRKPADCNGGAGRAWAMSHAIETAWSSGESSRVFPVQQYAERRMGALASHG